jgi:hypothetical protein
MIAIRPATASDIEAYNGLKELPPFRSYVWAAVDGETVIGLGGYSILPTGAAMLFLDADPSDTKANRLTLCKMAKAVMGKARKAGFRRLVAQCDEEIPRAREFLVWLGFTDTGEMFAYEDG